MLRRNLEALVEGPYYSLRFWLRETWASGPNPQVLGRLILGWASGPFASPLPHMSGSVHPGSELLVCSWLHFIHSAL